MEKISRHLRELLSAGDRPWSVDGSTIHVQLTEDKRHQCIDIVRDGDDYVLTCVVLSASDVTRTTKRWDELARLAWRRNAEHAVVSFGFDDRDRLIGQIRHPAAHLDAKEVDLYIQMLARQCDRFEYLLSGDDEF